MSWRKCPFQIGRQYRLKRDLLELNHALYKNEIVIFSNESYDPHNGVTRYWFKRQTNNESNAWHVWDEDTDPMQTWGELFEELSK